MSTASFMCHVIRAHLLYWSRGGDAGSLGHLMYWSRAGDAGPLGHLRCYVNANDETRNGTERNILDNHSKVIKFVKAVGSKYEPSICFMNTSGAL